MSKFDNITSDEWEEIERKEHDAQYLNSFPFDSKNYKIDKEHVLWWEDYCYKKGRRKDRGHRTKRLLEMVNINNLKGKKLLDVGCGNGQYSVLFAMFGADVYGVDITPVGINIAKKIAKENNISSNCHFSVQNATSLKFKNEKFDIVVMHEVLHHLIKYPGVKEEILRVLKIGGILVCAESLDGNYIFRYARRFTMRGIEKKGDVVLSLRDIETFVKDFSSVHIEMMTLLFMGKRIFIRILENDSVRSLLFLLKKTDDILLKIISPLKKYCGEIVFLAKK